MARHMELLETLADNIKHAYYQDNIVPNISKSAIEELGRCDRTVVKEDFQNKLSHTGQLSLPIAKV